MFARAKEEKLRGPMSSRHFKGRKRGPIKSHLFPFDLCKGSGMWQPRLADAGPPFLQARVSALGQLGANSISPGRKSLDSAATMGTCRGWRRGTMARQLLQLLGRAIILPACLPGVWRDGRGEPRRISHPPNFWERFRQWGFDSCWCAPPSLQ